MSPARIYAWAHAISAEDVRRIAARFRGLGMVLNAGNLDAAPDLERPPIAYVKDPAAARRVRDMARAGAPFLAVIVDDERNHTGPSGRQLTPPAYAARFGEIYQAVDGAAPVHTMGLAPIGGWARQATWCMRFDDTYHHALPDADGRGFNPNKVRRREFERALALDAGPWIISPAPFRGRLERFFEPLGVAAWAEVARHSRVRAVALWCLREHQQSGGRWQTEHGLLDRHGHATIVGKQVLDALK